jgi:hypothetical protein
VEHFHRKVWIKLTEIKDSLSVSFKLFMHLLTLSSQHTHHVSLWYCELHLHGCKVTMQIMWHTAMI